MMAVLPRVRFDNAYVEVRRVHAILPLVEWQGCSYSVPPEALGQLVECRAPLGESRLEIRLAGRQIALHHLALPRSRPDLGSRPPRRRRAGRPGTPPETSPPTPASRHLHHDDGAAP
jgi:hypothetical protein